MLDDARRRQHENGGSVVLISLCCVMILVCHHTMNAHMQRWVDPQTELGVCKWVHRDCGSLLVILSPLQCFHFLWLQSARSDISSCFCCQSKIPVCEAELRRKWFCSPSSCEEQGFPCLYRSPWWCSGGTGWFTFVWWVFSILLFHHTIKNALMLTWQR